MSVDKLNQLSMSVRQPILNLSWQTIHEGIDILARLMKPMKPHLIVAIARGGLIPATLLSHKLNCPLEVISASAYEGTRRTLQKPITVEGWKDIYYGEHVAFVDDIMDTGATWDAILYGDGRLATKMKASLFTLVAKDERRFGGFGNYFIQVPSDVWIKFPWEGDES